MRMAQVDFDALVHETENAWLVRIDKTEVWLPKSQCEDFDEEEGTVEVPEWLATEKGLL